MLVRQRVAFKGCEMGIRGNSVVDRGLNAIAMAACALVLQSAAISAQAETRTALTADEIEAMLSTAGLSPNMSEDAASGAPVARGELGSITFWVRGMDCSGRPTACSTLVFFANFDLGRAIQEADFKKVNRYNDSQVFGRAYVIESRGQLGIDYVIELDGGVSDDNVARNVSRWADVVAAFLAGLRSESSS